MTNNTVKTTENTYYNFTATCTAYINDIRVVTPENGKKKDAFVSLKVNILEGDKDEPNNVYADLIVRGDQAKTIIKAYREDWPSFKKKGSSWFAGLNIGSMYIKRYEHNGEEKTTLAGRLLKFTYLSINKEAVDLSSFEAQQPAPQPQAVAQVQQPAPQPQAVAQAQQPAPQPQAVAQAQQPAPQPHLKSFYPNKIH